jgi:hypothetical protein
MAQPVFDVVAEDPEKEHVAADCARCRRCMNIDVNNVK